jgi:hypothetical protein
MATWFHGSEVSWLLFSDTRYTTIYFTAKETRSFSSCRCAVNRLLLLLLHLKDSFRWKATQVPPSGDHLQTCQSMEVT